MDTPVELEHHGDIAAVFLNRPERLNAVNHALVVALVATLDEISGKPYRAVVLAGRGRAFCAGHDLKESGDGVVPLLERLEVLQDVTRRIRALPVPVIAAVHGHAVGAGAEFALGCDLVIAEAGTTFRFPEVGLGLSVTGGVTKLLPLMIGPMRAKELILLGEPFDAADAAGWGMVNRVVPQGEAVGTALAWAERLAAQPALSTALAKTALDRGIDSAFAVALSTEIADAAETDGAVDDGAAALRRSRARGT